MAPNESLHVDTGTEDLLARIEGHVGVLTFNRPERRNALSPAMYDAFGSVLPRMAANRQVRVLMVTGNGGAFCAGGDVKGMNDAIATGKPRAGRSSDQGTEVAILRKYQRDSSLALHHFPKPVVAALPGPAAGAGLSIALSADIRIAAERALLVTAFAGVGASGDFGGSWFLTQLVGTAKAKELYFTSPRMRAAEAKDLGLVNLVLPDDGFEETALDWCHELATRAPVALQLMKENLNRALVTDVTTAMDAEATAMVRAMSTNDHKEAVAAFVEKRTPKFNGD